MLAGLLLGGCSTSAFRAGTAAEDVARLLSGRFSSQAQAAADSRYFDIRLHVQRIWPERADGPWLYVEQAAATTPERPYRQRVYRIATEGEQVVSWVYTLPGDPLRLAGRGADAAAWAAITPAMLALREGCEVRLVRDGGLWRGGTQGTGCASDLRGARHATSEVVLDTAGMTSWDRGFDAQGRQVWGATAGGYRFDRLEAAPPAPPAPPR